MMSNKQKAMGKMMMLSIGDKAKEETEEIRLTVCVEKTNIDGKSQKTYKIKPCCMEGEDSIFTDKKKFIDELSKLVDEAPKSESEDDEESDTTED